MITILFLGISILTVYSFVPILVRTEGGSPFGYLFKHLVYIVIGFVTMYWVHKQEPKKIEKLSKFIFYVAVGLLIFTFFFGISVNNASRWVRVPIIGLTFQSSDFAKLALVIFLSRRLVSKRNYFSSWKKGFFPVIMPIVIICALIAKDNFSTAVIIFLVALILLFIAGFPFGKMLSFIGGGIALGGIFVLLHIALPAANLLPRFDTWMNRFFKAYGDGEGTVGNMQALNAEMAIHNGGYTGVGIGDGTLKHYTPQAYADFFYSSYVEELGLIGALVLIFLYLILFYRIIKIGLNATNLFETLVSIGIGLLIISQVSVNMFVCTGLMPVTGQNMPFLAMGGSAMFTSCLSLGIVLAIANKNSKHQNDESQNSKLSKSENNEN